MAGQDRKAARVAGALFILAIVTSILGGAILESVLDAPDYLATISESENQVIAGVLLELVNGLAVVGIAATLFPILRKQNEAMALGYAGFRIVEVAIIVAGALIPLLMVTLGEDFQSAAPANNAYFETTGAIYLSARSQLVGLILVIFFAMGALLLYSLLYQSRLVPSLLSIWGFTGVGLVLIWNLLETFGISITWGIVLGLPIILNELFLGIYLIARGFNSTEIAAGEAMLTAA